MLQLSQYIRTYDTAVTKRCSFYNTLPMLRLLQYVNYVKLLQYVTAVIIHYLFYDCYNT